MQKYDFFVQRTVKNSVCQFQLKKTPFVFFFSLDLGVNTQCSSISVDLHEFSICGEKMPNDVEQYKKENYEFLAAKTVKVEPCAL